MSEFAWVPILIGVLAGLAAIGGGAYAARQFVTQARLGAARLLDDAKQDAENARKEIVVSAQEKALALQETFDVRQRELDERDAELDTRQRELEATAAELERERREVDRRRAALDGREGAAAEAEREAESAREAAAAELTRVASMTREEARQELVESVEREARVNAERLARKIEDEARHTAEREARELVVRAAERLDLRDVLESTVSFIELPNDDMKGRIIGKEGRNIRALEMATGIDLIVDDTPRSIWISCFDPLRRETARLAIERLLEDGRIHPARIEEAVEKASERLGEQIEERGNEAAFSLGITDLDPRLLRLVGRMRFHSAHGSNLLQHALETAWIGAHMAEELGTASQVLQRAGLLHEIGQVADDGGGHPLEHAADLCAKYGEADDVVQAIRSLRHDAPVTTIHDTLLGVANRLSESRPGARKENLSVFIERLRRLETIALRYPDVERCFAVKSGKELRVMVDASRAGDDRVYKLAREIARSVERELAYPGQIKVTVVRHTRAVRYAT